MTSASPRADFAFPTRYRLGAGRRRELPKLLRDMGATRALVVTDPGVSRLAFCAEIVASLTEAGIAAEVFSEVHGNPTVGDAMAGGARARALGADVVVALGGGSAIDCAKGVAVAARHDGGLLDYELAESRWRRIDAARLLRTVAIPTTAGTGSEMALAAVIVDEQTRKKRILWHPSLAPVLVIADPETTVGLPRGLTAATGMDALSHAIEAYSAKGFHPMCDGIAVEAMRLVRKSLVRACEEPTDLEARSDMLVAASMGAVAFQKGLGVLHAIAHPLGGLTDLHHGTLNAILLPHVIRYNRQALVERADRLARWLDLDAPRRDAERSGTSPVGWGVDALLAWVDDLRSRLAIPARLADLGVSPDVIPEVARRAPEDPSFANNPITPTQADLEGILRAAIEGG